MTSRADTWWGRWGPADERGALNLIGHNEVIAASRLVEHGKIYSLAIPIQRSGVPIFPHRGAPQRLTTVNDQDQPRHLNGGVPSGTGPNADMLIAATHNGTHIDALCHVYSDWKLYNGFPSDSFKTADGAQHCGIEKMGGIVSRAVLLDFAGLVGAPVLDETVAISGKMIAAAERRQDIEIRAGDIVLLHTGWLGHYFAGEANGTPPSLYDVPGLGMSGAEYLIDRDVAAIGADNPAVEIMSSQSTTFLQLHLELLVNRGIPLLEHLDLRQPISDGVNCGMFIAAPLPITGASGSPINPLLIV